MMFVELDKYFFLWKLTLVEPLLHMNKETERNMVSFPPQKHSPTQP